MKEIFTNEHVEIVEKRTLFQGFFSVDQYSYRHKLYQGGWSRLINREVFERGNAVGVLLYDPAVDSFVLIEQCRAGALVSSDTIPKKHVSPWLMEIVAGMVEPGETPDDVALREANEEAGGLIKKLIPMCEYWVSPGGSSEFVWLYLGIVDCSTVDAYGGLESEQEDIRVEVVDREQLLHLLQQGSINNAMALIAVQWFLLNEKELDFSITDAQ